jgi:hypothetical protein
VPRRVNLPNADDLFRPTDGTPSANPGANPGARAVHAVPDPAAPGRPSGRVKHDEKVTVYLTSQELLDIERARLVLRGDHGLAVDRGRLLREAVSLVLAEFDEQGCDSALVRRLEDR